MFLVENTTFLLKKHFSGKKIYMLNRGRAYIKNNIKGIFIQL